MDEHRRRIREKVLQKITLLTKLWNITIPSRKAVIAAAIAITVAVIIDYLGSRQMFPYDNFSGAIISGLTIVTGAIGSFIILKYVSQASADIRTKSLLFDRMFKVVTSTMFVLIATFIVMFLGFYYYNVSVRYLGYFVFSLSTIVSAGIMITIGFKFFSWYKISRDRDKDTHRLLLICGLAAASLATAMAFDAGSKMLLVRVVEEKSPTGAVPQDTFIYKNDEKYQGEIQYKVIKPDTTTVYIVPSSIKIIYQYLNGWIPITVSFVFTWAITAMLLRQYHRQRVGKMPTILFVLLTIPLLLYMIGRFTELYTLFTGIVWHWENFPNAYLFKSIFRAGLIAGSAMFGVAFIVIARKIQAGKIRDYFTIAAIGAMMMSITLAPSGLQQTFGVTGRALMLLASFMLCAGFYLSAIHMAQDASSRRSIKTSAGSKVFGVMASAQLRQENAQIGQENEANILDIIEKEREVIKDQTGIHPLLEQEDMKAYLDRALQELQSKRKMSNKLTKGAPIT
ncbi:MAG: hypothetical protein M3247_09005 [Thermoproteota archaeon]|nr:hypothetical protein [Thermoproteota archaeon]